MALDECVLIVVVVVVASGDLIEKDANEGQGVLAAVADGCLRSGRGRICGGKHGVRRNKTTRNETKQSNCRVTGVCYV